MDFSGRAFREHQQQPTSSDRDVHFPFSESTCPKPRTLFAVEPLIVGKGIANGVGYGIARGTSCEELPYSMTVAVASNSVGALVRGKTSSTEKGKQQWTPVSVQ